MTRQKDTARQEKNARYKRESEFGCGPWRPKYLQFLAGLWPSVGLFTSGALLQTATQHYTISQISSIEDYFRISSSESGLLLSARDIGIVSFSLICGHFGSFIHIPRWLSLSSIVIGTALLLMSLVQLATLKSLPSGTSINTNYYNHFNQTQISKHLCTDEFSLSAFEPLYNTSETINLEDHLSGVGGDNDKNGALPWSFFWCVFCNFLYGAAVSVNFTFQTLYVERNVQEAGQAGRYIGVLAAALIFGIPVGLFLGGYINEIPVDLRNTEMNPTDPRWISAWWLGYAYLGCVSILTALPVFCLPRYIRKEKKGVWTKPNAEVHHATGSSGRKASLFDPVQQFPDYSSVNHLQLQQDGYDSQKPNSHWTLGNDNELLIQEETPSLEKIKEAIKSLQRILTYPMVRLMVVEAFLFNVALQGLLSFKLKYFEDQYDMSSSTVSFHLGIGHIIAAISGTLLGGYILSHFKLTRAAMFKASVFFHVAALCFFTATVFLGCNNHKILGFNQSDSNYTDHSDCMCSNTTILFVCGDDGLNYLSPCTAGCRTVDGLNFKNCSRIAGDGRAVPGLCDNGCTNYVPGIVTTFLQSFFVSMEFTTHVLMSIRIAAPEDRASVSSLLNGFVTTAAGVAGPIISGRLYDASCLIWQVEHGACALYDKDDLRHLFLGASFLLRIIALVVLVAATIFIHRQDKMEEKALIEESPDKCNGCLKKAGE